MAVPSTHWSTGYVWGAVCLKSSLPLIFIYYVVPHNYSKCGLTLTIILFTCALFFVVVERILF